MIPSSWESPFGAFHLGCWPDVSSETSTNGATAIGSIQRLLSRCKQASSEIGMRRYEWVVVLTASSLPCEFNPTNVLPAPGRDGPSAVAHWRSAKNLRHSGEVYHKLSVLSDRSPRRRRAGMGISTNWPARQSLASTSAARLSVLTGRRRETGRSRLTGERRSKEPPCKNAALGPSTGRCAAEPHVTIAR